MSTDITPQEDQIPIVQGKYDDATFSTLATSAKWLPRLQMFGSKSDPVTAGLVPPATYAIVTGKDQYLQLGPMTDILVINWRPKALDLRGEKPVGYHNPESDSFKEVQEESFKQDSNCLFGPEFLVYVPQAKRFCTLLMGSKTARREAPNLRALIGKAATLRVTLIETKKYKWHAVVVQPCTTPFELPSPDETIAVQNDFPNPEDVIEETAEAPEREV